MPATFHLIKHVLGSLLFCLCMTSANAYVIEVTGSQVKPLLGQKAADYGIFAVDNNAFVPVAHQWLDWAVEDVPYFSEDHELTVDGKAGIIDTNDRLLLRFEDGGNRLSPSIKITAKPAAELAITHAGQVRYFYLVKNPYQHSDKSYVDFDTQKMVIKTNHFALFVDENNLLQWNDFYYKGYKTANGSRQSILDTMKLRLSAGVLSKKTRMTLANDNLQPHIRQVIKGPLATLIYADTSLKVAGIKVLSISNYFVIEPNQTNIHTRFTLPKAAELVLNEPSISISLDGNGLYGSELHTSWTGNSIGVTDGTMSPQERSMENSLMPKDGWILFDTKRNFSLLAQLLFSQNLTRPVTLLYQDDASLENKPERYVGQLPNVGFSIENLPFGQLFAFQVKLLYSGNSPRDPYYYAHDQLSPPEVNYHAF